MLKFIAVAGHIDDLAVIDQAVKDIVFSQMVRMAHFYTWPAAMYELRSARLASLRSEQGAAAPYAASRLSLPVP